ncbi:MAG: 2-C-methyl-D-erythritol 4-phosphate cytidylyltransferase [Chthoniobacterales bacterium]
MLTAIIVAGGSSRRMGFDKTFAPLGGRPVIAHTVAAFESAACVEEIILVGRAERLGELRDVVTRYSFPKVRHVVAGGVLRQHSVSAGLAALAPGCRFVAVHDAARPLVTAAQIERVLAAAQTHGGAALASPVTDTLKRAGQDHVVCGAVEREGLFAMQTPQIFARDALQEAYARVAAGRLSITDEVSAFEHLGRKVVLVRNDETNLKITFPADLALAEWLLAHQQRAKDGPPDS